MTLTLAHVQTQPTAQPKIDQCVLQGLCVRAAAIGGLCSTEPSEWLADVCEHIRQSYGHRARCTAAIFRETEQGHPQLEFLGASDGYPSSHNRFIQNCIELRNTNGLFLGMPGVDGTCPGPTTRNRGALLSDALWRDSALFDERARLGLHDFAWSVVRADEATPARHIALQLDGATPEWTPGEIELRMLSALVCVARSAFVHGPLADQARRDDLLGLLSPMRRKVAPMLASGLSESEIAESLDRSKHTVHEHAKAIYQSWRVNSRRELRDLWLGRIRIAQPQDRVA